MKCCLLKNDCQHKDKIEKKQHKYGHSETYFVYALAHNWPISSVSYYRENTYYWGFPSFHLGVALLSKKHWNCLKIHCRECFKLVLYISRDIFSNEIWGVRNSLYKSVRIPIYYIFEIIGIGLYLPEIMSKHFTRIKMEEVHH